MLIFFSSPEIKSSQLNVKPSSLLLQVRLLCVALGDEELWNLSKSPNTVYLAQKCEYRTVKMIETNL